MSERIDSKSANERLKAEPGSIYLDVRSILEFEQGHPPGAWNIPVFHATPAGMEPNHEFLDVASRVLPKDALVVVGCKSGQRSGMACEMLSRAGFTNCVNLAGGFQGQTDFFGRVVVPGWLQLGLESTTEPTPGKSWDDLK